MAFFAEPGKHKFAKVDIFGRNANALVVSPDNNSAEVNPAFRVDTDVAAAATGLKITPAAAASRVALAVISSGTNEGLDIDSKGSGTIRLNNTGTGAITTPRSLVSTGATAGVGYATGAGGAVTQATSKATGATLNTICGAITMNGAALAAAATVGFTFTNSAIDATDVVAVSIKSGATADSYDQPVVDAVAAGSCRIQIRNKSAGSLSEALVLNFVVIKAVAA